MASCLFCPHQVVVSGEYNYSDPIIQAQMENLTQTLENSTYISSPLYTESWLRSFLGYVTRNQDYLNATIDNEKDFIASLKELWLFPANPFSLDVKFNDAGDRILASRFLIQAVNVTDTNQEKDMVINLRRICAESPLNASVFHPYFVFFDQVSVPRPGRPKALCALAPLAPAANTASLLQFMLVRPTTIQCMIIGAIIMMVISFIFIPNILCSLWVAFSIISIEIGVAGYMCLWDIHLDSISMINLIMCIGFSVDFTAHICYAYMSSKARTSEERVRECLHSLGLPIFQGATSTILGIIALVLADSYIFLVFFKMVFMVIFFGAMHGLFLLPVLLSIFGPGACSSGSVLTPAWQTTWLFVHRGLSSTLPKVPKATFFPAAGLTTTTTWSAGTSSPPWRRRSPTLTASRTRRCTRRSCSRCRTRATGTLPPSASRCRGCPACRRTWACWRRTWAWARRGRTPARPARPSRSVAAPPRRRKMSASAESK